MSNKTKILMFLVWLLNDKLDRKRKYPYPHYYFVAGTDVGMYNGCCALMGRLADYGIEAGVTQHGITVCLLRWQKAVLRQFLREVEVFNLRDTKTHQKVDV